MFIVTVTRRFFTERSSIGMMDLNGVFQCYTLEPPLKTEDGLYEAIPYGSYDLALLPSKRFQTYTPHILNVPNRTAIEIHPGNKPADTHGCVLVGTSQWTDWIGESELAFNNLMGQLESVDKMQIIFTEFKEKAISA